MKAIDILYEEYVTEGQLIALLQVDSKRVRDLRSHHCTGKEEFIPFIKPSTKQVLYRLKDVQAYLNRQKLHIFGISSKDSE